MELLLNTVRIVDHDQQREYASGDDQSLKENLAVGIINPQDFKNLNLLSNQNLKLTNQFGSVVIRVKQEENVQEGSILLPISIWSNQITGVENGEIIYKNLKVNVEITSDSVLSFKEILGLLKKN